LISPSTSGFEKAPAVWRPEKRRQRKTVSKGERERERGRGEMIERITSREVLPGCPAVGDYRAKLKSGARALVNANESFCPKCKVFPATPYR